MLAVAIKAVGAYTEFSLTENMDGEQLTPDEALLRIRREFKRAQLEKELDALEKDLEREKLQRELTKDMLEESDKNIEKLRTQIEGKRNDIFQARIDFLKDLSSVHTN